MTTVGVVKSVEGKTARVLVDPGPSCCEHCEKDSCDLETRGVETEAINLAGAEVGQKVRIDIGTVTYVKGILVLYILPVFALLAGAVLGRAYLPAYFKEASPDALSAAGAFLLFFVSLLLAKLLSGKIEKKKEHKPVIESIIEE